MLGNISYSIFIYIDKHTLNWGGGGGGGVANPPKTQKSQKATPLRPP